MVCQDKKRKIFQRKSKAQVLIFCNIEKQRS